MLFPIKPADIPLMHVQDADTLYCVYELYSVDAASGVIACQFVSFCKLDRVYSFAEARRNSEWQKVFPAGTPMMVSIVALAENMTEAQKEVARIYQLKRPHCNVKGHHTGGRTMIVCNETGEVFSSISEAARIKGLSQSQLTNHINHKPNFKSVKGLTFKRGMPT